MIVNRRLAFDCNSRFMDDARSKDPRFLRDLEPGNNSNDKIVNSSEDIIVTF